MAVLCEVLTDNRNRTAGELRKAFEVCGGNLGASGCVSYLFNYKGLFVIDAKTVAEDRLMEVALEAGADDIELDRRLLRGHLRPQGLRDRPQGARSPQDRHRDAPRRATSRPRPVDLDVDNGKRMLKLRDILDENEDVQNVYANDNIPEAAMA